MGKTDIGITLLLSFILLASTAAIYHNPQVPLAEAQQQLSAEMRNWEYVNHNLAGTNYNPQTLINKDNVNLLELKWFFPYPNVTPIPGESTREGSTAPALVVDGVVYTVSNMGDLIALNAESGKVLWTSGVKYNSTALKAKYPHVQNVRNHRHSLNYYKELGIIIPTLTGCQLDAFDALTGKIKFQIFELCGTKAQADAWGSQGFYGPGDHPGAVFGNIMVVPVAGASGRGGRTFIAGYDISDQKNPRRVWQTFMQPPAQGDPEWALRECSKGWFAPSVADQKRGVLGVKCTDIPREVLLNDWIDPAIGKLHSASAVSNFWGHAPLDPETGIEYFGMGEIGPYFNGSRRPGPNLYGSSIVAINARTGAIVWWFQDNPHDLWDMDCSWNTILGKIGTRKVVFKACKGGIWRALDAATGEPIWLFDPPSVWRREGAPIIGLDPKSNSLQGGMRTPWPEYPKTTNVLVNGGTNGVQESDYSFDGKRLYVAPYNRPRVYNINPVTDFGNQAGTAKDPHPNNSTIWAIDATTGKPVWSFFIAGVGYRGGIITSGGVVYVPSPDGNLYALDADTGKALLVKPLGSAVNVQASIGATANGKMRLFVQIGGAGTFGTPVPGGLMAFGLPDKIPEPQVITKEVIKEVPKEVVKEVIKEVPKEVVKEVIKEVPKEVVKEVVKEVPKEVTKTVTVETLSPITYVGVGLGIIIAVVGLVVGRRGRKVA